MIALGGRWPWPTLLSLVALAAGLASGWHLLERLGILLIALLLLCLAATMLSALALRVEGRPRARAATAGDLLPITYIIRNRSPWPVIWALLRPQGFSPQPVEGQLVTLPWRGVRRLDVAIPCPQRGRWLAGGSQLHTGDPFGFFERVRSSQGRHLVTVYPRPVALPGFHLPALLGRGIAPRGRPGPQPSAGVREVRPYRPGDLPSRIHWLSTARLDSLMVKDPEGEPASHLWLVLDLRTAVQYGEGGGSSEELLVGAAGYLIQSALPPWLATGLLIVGPGTRVMPDTRRRQSGGLLTALAVAEPGEEEVGEGLRAIGEHRAGRRGAVLLLTPWAGEAWVQAVTRLAGMGHAVLCLLLDTPDSGRTDQLAVQADQLRRAGGRVYRHTAWAA